MTARPSAFDYSWGRPSPQKMAAFGIKAVCRYLTGSGKAVTRAEIDALHAAGIGVVLNFEQSAGDAKGGSSRGRAAGAIARATAKSLGAPAGTPIYYSVDFDVTTEMPAVLAYLRAADSPDYPARAYGEYSVVEAFGRPGWQTYAWSGGRLSDHAVLYQFRNGQTFDGSPVDYNQIINAARLGAWWRAGLMPDSGSASLIGGFMSELSAAEQRNMYNRVMGFLVQRWYTVDSAGKPHACPQGTAGARPATALDSLDGNYIVGRINALADPAQIAAAVVAALPKTTPGVGLTEADVETAVRKVFADAGSA